MSDNPTNKPEVPKADAKAEVKAETKAEAPKPEVPPVKAKKGWLNPALRAMGIPRLSLPLRNWMIFWLVLASIGGGIAYDKYQQKQIRHKYMDMVKHLGEEVYANDRIPRKVTVFIAPPPNDFLDESLRYFRKYVKPILNAAAVDFEVYTENRQGEIRNQVAERIREMRREAAEPKKQEQPEKQTTGDEEETRSRHLLYNPRDVLGVYRIFGEITPKRDDETAERAGGVICIGRGSYKEYITGVHEGLLGPLDKPAALVEEEAEYERKAEEDKKDKLVVDDDDEDSKKPVTKPYILPLEYDAAALAPELDLSRTVLNKKNVPVLFEQPVYAYPVPNLLGFLTMPQKIYRYFTKRTVAEDYGRRTLAIIYNEVRPFEFKDQYMAKEEELDWPKKWVQKGIDKGSEWVQELAVDQRVTGRMSVFEPGNEDSEPKGM